MVGIGDQGHIKGGHGVLCRDLIIAPIKCPYMWNVPDTRGIHVSYRGLEPTQGDGD